MLNEFVQFLLCNKKKFAAYSCSVLERCLLQQEPWELMVESMEATKFIVSIASAYRCCTSDPFLKGVIELMSLI